MVTSLHAIETKYKGYRFRSRLEARWAVFFDTLGVKWEYEKEGYDLGEAGRYLPDFWLPEHESWVEIKGQRETEHEKELARKLHMATTFPVYIFSGEIGYLAGETYVVSGWYTGTDSSNSGGGLGDDYGTWGYCAECSAAVLNPYIFSPDRVALRANWEPMTSPCKHTGNAVWLKGGLWHPRINSALNAARSARFEFGETGR